MAWLRASIRIAPSCKGDCSNRGLVLRGTIRITPPRCVQLLESPRCRACGRFVRAIVRIVPCTYAIVETWPRALRWFESYSCVRFVKENDSLP